MRTEFLKELGLTDEVISKVMAENGKDVEREKAKTTAVEAELKEKKESFNTLTTEFNTLKESNATAEDFKEKYESLVKENKAREEKAEADRLAKEKADGILSRFDTVVGEKKFAHDAIRTDYLAKFTEALESKDYEGKSDSDILHLLTKDDAAAFQNVTALKLEGGQPGFTGADIDDAKVREVMGLPPIKN